MCLSLLNSYRFDEEEKVGLKKCRIGPTAVMACIGGKVSHGKST